MQQVTASLIYIIGIKELSTAPLMQAAVFIAAIDTRYEIDYTCDLRRATKNHKKLLKNR